MDEARGRSLSRWCLGKGAEWRNGSRTFLFFFGGRCQGSQVGRVGCGGWRVSGAGGEGVRREKRRGARREKKWIRVGVDAKGGY